MITFVLCAVLLIVGYLTYGKYVTKVFGPDDRQTPAYALEDGVDYVPMPTATYFMAAGECMGQVWTPMGIPMSTYYPIAVVVGVVFAAAMMALFLGKIKKYKTLPL